VSRPDYDGFGFSMKSSEKGPHQISGVEQESPAHVAGLRPDDLILKINEQLVVGERYSRTVTIIKNESQSGRLKLEVIEASECPSEIRNVPLNTTSHSTDTLTSQQSQQITTASIKKQKSTSGSIENLKNITEEAINETKKAS
jgi:predicted metalloprotease with PDZ domain